MDESRKLSSGEMMTFEKIYPLDAAYDTMADVPEDMRTNKRYKERRRLLDRRARAARRGAISARSRSTSSSTRSPTAPR